MTQRDRVLRALQSGPVNTTDFINAPTDGGKPILRLAARIHDLQAQGYRIRSERKLNGTRTYFLEGVLPTGGRGGDSPAAPAALFAHQPIPHWRSDT